MRGRRTLLGAAAALAVVPLAQAGAATVLPSPDAELIALCGQYFEMWGRWNALCRHDHPEGSAECQAYDTAQERIEAIAEPMMRRALALPCTTLAGFRALASALVTWDGDLLAPGRGDAGTVMAANMVRRLLALEDVA